MPELDLSSANVDAIDGMFEETPDSGGAEDSKPEETTTEVDTPGTEGADLLPEPEAVETPEVETPEVETPEVEAPKETPKDGVEGELPEGVTVRERDGKKFWTYEEKRGRAIYEGYEQARKAAEIMQEPLTTEALQVRENALRDLEWMRLDYLSGEPAKQAAVFMHFLRKGSEAYNSGEVAEDPTGTAASVFVDLLAKHAPEAHAAVAAKFQTDTAELTRSLIRDAYKKGKASGDKNLAVSAQHIAKALTNDYKWLDEPEEQPDPLKQREETVREAERRIATRSQQEERSKVDAWNRDTVTKVSGEVQSAIDQSLERVKKSYEKFPERLKNLRLRLEQEVKSAIQSDESWRQTNEQLYVRASLARSEQIRSDVRDHLAKRYSAKARAVLERVKTAILSEDAVLMKAESGARNDRRERAQERTTPAKAGAPANPRIPVVPKGRTVNRDDWSNAVDAMFGS